MERSRTRETEKQTHDDKVRRIDFSAIQVFRCIFFCWFVEWLILHLYIWTVWFMHSGPIDFFLLTLSRISLVSSLYYLDSHLSFSFGAPPTHTHKKRFKFTLSSRIANKRTIPNNQIEQIARNACQSTLGTRALAFERVDTGYSGYIHTLNRNQSNKLLKLSQTLIHVEHFLSPIWATVNSWAQAVAWMRLHRGGRAWTTATTRYELCMK